MLDADLQRFAHGLNQTKSGLRLRLAMHEGAIAVNQIERLQRLGGNVGRAVDSWRRAYIRASEHGSKAIDDLWNQHQWPTDGARTRDYEWQPAERRKR